jgi:glucan phosphoethanolaminetransferase (alkaline phosphatase superfamily)
MIQRKQTLFLLAVVIIAIAQFFITFQNIVIPNGHWPLSLMPGSSSDITNSNIYFPIIFNVIILILSVAIIFLYKNRVLQYKLANLLVVFNMFLVGLFFILTYTKEGGPEVISYQFGSFLPLISAVFAYLAAHFIKKDEQLVRSADRIR